jgi:hypothetical protein
MNREYAKEAIKVMQAFVEGKEIEYREKGRSSWAASTYDNMGFDWRAYEYRIKKEPAITYEIVNRNDAVVSIADSKAAAERYLSAYRLNAPYRIRRMVEDTSYNG